MRDGCGRLVIGIAQVVAKPCLNREERENQQDATIRCLLSTSVSTCFGHRYSHLQENKDRVLLYTVYCAGSAECGL